VFLIKFFTTKVTLHAESDMTITGSLQWHDGEEFTEVAIGSSYCFHQKYSGSRIGHLFVYYKHHYQTKIKKITNLSCFNNIQRMQILQRSLKLCDYPNVM
jgi:hypothetical protein